MCDRLPEDGAEVASQPMVSLFENANRVKALLRIRELFVERFIASLDENPSRLTFDLGGFDNPAHVEKWPDVEIKVRTDSRLGVPSMHDQCERLSVRSMSGIAQTVDWACLRCTTSVSD